MGISDIEVIHAGPAVLTAFEGDETQHDGESPQDYVVRTACEKARQAMDRIAAEGKPSLPVLAADTVVICGDEILGKPEDAAKARLFMQKLSGRTHEVRTAVVVSDVPENTVYGGVPARLIKTIEEDSAMTKTHDNIGTEGAV